MKVCQFSLIILQVLSNSNISDNKVWSFTLPSPSLDSSFAKLGVSSSSSSSSFIAGNNNSRRHHVNVAFMSSNSDDNESSSVTSTSTSTSTSTTTSTSISTSTSSEAADTSTTASTSTPTSLNSESSESSKSSATKKATSDADRLKMQARKIKLEAQKLEAELTLLKLDKLEQNLSTLSTDNTANDSTNTSSNTSTKDVDIGKQREEIVTQLQTIAKNMNIDMDPSLLQTESLPLNPNANDSTTTTTSTTTATTATTNKIETNLYKDYKPTQPKPSITEAELTEAVQYYNSLPKQMRKTLANAIDLNDEFASPSIIVLGLYEFLGTTTLRSDRLQQLYTNFNQKGGNDNDDQAQKYAVDEAMKFLNSQDQQRGMIGTGNGNGNANNNNNNNSLTDNILGDTKLETMIESFLPRVTRKEGKEPSLEDVNMLKTYDVLGKDTFQMSTLPQQVPGGYIIRGSIVPKLRGDCNKLIQLLDERITQNIDNGKTPNDSSYSTNTNGDASLWNEKYQINIMTDPTPTLFEDESGNFDGETVLVIHSRDMKPMTNQFLLSSVSTLSLFLTLVFTIATYSQNDVVMERLTSANAIGDFDATWFNELISPMLISIGVTQLCHELGHLFIAKKDGFKITPPTIMPLIALPYMSFQQNLKTSPKNFQSLFNFGFIGPAIGMVVSSIFFYVGLQLTLTMDASALEYAPSVPVLFLKLSSLGGTVVDNVIGGGQGIITQQDPLTPVKLHPFAIGGLASLMINCLDTIPLPGTDGGRMSQSLLGRSGQVAFGGVVYFALLAYTFLSGHSDLFLAFLLINSFSRQDNEIPCRNEIDRAGLGQAAIALVMWCVAILTLTPLD
jgi:hypothetical protein